MKSKFIQNFSFLAISLFAIKLLGGLYRIPLANFLDSEGMGLYQMVFPLFSLFLTITSSAIPSSISKLVSDSNNDPVKIATVFKTSRRFVLLGSLVATIVLMIFSAQFAKLQGNINAQIPYILIAPSVFFVGYLALYRGIYQGKLDMRPTAISQIIEQIVKIAFGLLLAYIFRSNIIFAVYGTIFAVTISELVALMYIRIKAKNIKMHNIGAYNKSVAKSLFSLVLPMTISFSLTPLLVMIESRLILSNTFSTLGALSDFGLYHGCALTLIGVPIALISALGIVLIPYLGHSKKDIYSISLRFSLVILPLFALGFFFFSNNIVNSFFSKFTALEKTTLSSLIRFSSLTVILQGLHVLTTSTLYGLNRPRIPLFSLLGGGLIKITILVVALPKYGIIVAVFSDWVCYFVALMVNLIYIIVIRKTQLPKGMLISLATLYSLCTVELLFAERFLSGLVAIAVSIIALLVTAVVILILTNILFDDEKNGIFDVLLKRRIKNEN